MATLPSLKVFQRTASQKASASASIQPAPSKENSPRSNKLSRFDGPFNRLSASDTSRAERDRVFLSLASLLLRMGSLRMGLLVLGLLLACGCSRTQYRLAADQEAYDLVDSRQHDPRWDIPTRAVEPSPLSRMHLAADLDCGPKPMDDMAAKRYMDDPYCIDNTKYYSKIGTRGHFENPAWIEYLPRNEDDQIELTLPLALDLALLHSRDYQTRYENVYLTALNLSGNRFEFDCQWFGGLGTNFSATGEDLGGQRLLGVSDRLGFGRNLAGGGQFATSVLNNLFWDFGNSGVAGGSANIVSTFTQPLLRGAFRHVRLENLTQAERNLLYSVRDFARFRRLFYLSVTDSYFDLLTQVQAIRNTRTNVQNLRMSLDEYELYIDLGIVSPVEVDQVYQNYQDGRRRLLAAEQSLAASLDRFKFQLGLPAWVPFEIDESWLEPFELVDPELIQLQDDAQALYQSLVQYLPPAMAPQETLQQGLDEYAQLRNQVIARLPAQKQELQIWIDRLKDLEERELSSDDQLDLQQQQTFGERIQKGFDELEVKLDNAVRDRANIQQLIDKYHDEPEVAPSSQSPLATESEVGEPRKEDIEIQPEVIAWRALLNAVGRDLREEIAELYVAQTQSRLFLIDIEPLDIQEQTAITFAFQNRLDMMNGQAEVMDAFRKLEVAADALESELNVTGQVGLGSDPGINNAFRLDSSANTYRVGVQFDGPLNRLNERNAYRATQITYQQTNRNFIALKDSVANDVRSVLRQLQLRRLNFQIARQQLVAATRQVDQAQIALRTSNVSNSNLTLFLLQALQQLLDAKNNLISEWIRYRIEKIRLFTTLELLYLDEQGNWINEDSGLDQLNLADVVDPEYFPPSWMLPNGAFGNSATNSDAANERGPAEEIAVPPAGPDSLELPSAQVSPPGQAAVETQQEAKSSRVLPRLSPVIPAAATENNLQNPESLDENAAAKHPLSTQHSQGVVLPSVPYAFGFGD